MPSKAKPSPRKRRKPATRPVLLSGGNPQIAKADGDAPVQAYIAALSGWKRDIAFFRGSALRLMPPGESASPDTRYLDIREHDELDEAQLARWIRQAAALPGWGARNRA